LQQRRQLNRRNPLVFLWLTPHHQNGPIDETEELIGLCARAIVAQMSEAGSAPYRVLTASWAAKALW
jgi:hypothetical protein